MEKFEEYAKNKLDMSDKMSEELINDLKELAIKRDSEDFEYFSGSDLITDFLTIMHHFKITQEQLEPTIEALYYSQYGDISSLIANTVLIFEFHIGFMEIKNYEINEHSSIYDKILKHSGLRENDETANDDY